MMRKYFLILLFTVTTGFLSYGQTADSLLANCVMTTGTDAKYLKDFRIQLGKSVKESDFRYKAKMSLWKNTKYRFTMCNGEESKGALILRVKDEDNKVVLSSFDLKSGKTFPVVDFECRKSGIYQISYDFMNGQQGSGVAIVSMVK
jgi:hypothetical protein